MYKPFLNKLNMKIINELKSGTYKSCMEFVQILLNSNNYYVEQLKQLLSQCLGQHKLDEIEPIECQIKMYLTQATIYKLENKCVNSLKILHDALLLYPDDDIIDSLIIFINDSQFHQTLRAILINDIRKISVNLTDINPPTKTMNLRFLKQSDRLTMLKKYERSIIKRLTEDDPVQAALSYIDLCMALPGDPTLYAINMLMACIYFYKSMTVAKKQLSELYAYRSIILDLSSQLFLFTRHYLPLYVQMYLYKLLFTLILRSNNLFKDSLLSLSKNNKIMTNSQRNIDEAIITDYQGKLIEELIKNIVQLSKNYTIYTYANMFII
ncbi:unnamed protein product [Didymodactylos carnosus]|uniref:Uncharacterized protein n=1 Tax=Didymodactylos carnosus TaxID=1234261 RepID=A0A8S2V156_9BILA|nr:unnamed protein product [Didymodactylos carnosus]CAF4368176.1 unnamed protein product [Didymodactylos carnosus]